MKHNSDKSKFLEILRENPWISFACKKVGISRATIYRWMKDTPDFNQGVEDAIRAGNLQLGEIAEMGLVKNIKEGNINAIKYYLSNTNQRYVPKRSEFVFPPNHQHYDDPERCERCGRISIEKEAERKEWLKEINEEFKKLANPKTKKDKKGKEKIMKEALESGRKREVREKEKNGY